MLLGLLSDSHDKLPATRAAIQTLLDAGATRFLHCGDLCNQRVIDLLAGLDVDFVFGNNEMDTKLLADYARALGVRCLQFTADLDLDGVPAAVTHGDRKQTLHKLFTSGKYRYVFHGHTHVRRDERVGPTRVINPGALHRALPKSCAVLDTTADELTYYDITA